MAQLPNKAHFVGIGGIGVSAILRLFVSKGISVSGSDVHIPPKETLPLGEYFEGHRAENIPHDTEMLIYSPAVPESNPERKRAAELGILQLSYPEALGRITKPYNTIAVSGTHGKSTTTALMGKLFESGGLDPSVIVGAEVSGWDHNLLKGHSDIFIVEACEYRRSMMNLFPQTIVLTNVELDHPDYYIDLADVKHAFKEYITKLSGEDLLIINNDDANIRDVIRDSDAIIVRYGVGEGADLIAHNIRQTEALQSFELTWKGTSLGTFTTRLPGLYNIYNILASVAAYLAYGGKQDAIQKVLDSFTGVGRRFEIIGEYDGATIISDYAHHPTALRAVTEAAALRYKDKRILVVFRPHHRERTIKLFDEFVNVIGHIPNIILIEIYDVAGREESVSVSSRDIIEKISEHNKETLITYAEDLPHAEELIREQAKNFDIILIIGAGDAGELATNIIHSK